MTLAHCFDAEFPPVTAPPHCAAVLGYIGGARASRAWDLAEWDRFEHLRQFPAYVPDMGADPVGQATEAVALMRARGWRRTRALIADLETGANPEWWAGFAVRVLDLDQIPVAYGSASTVFRNKAMYYWVADWDDIPQLDQEPNQAPYVDATQYAAGIPWASTRIDLSVVSDQLLRCGGVGRRI
jgi:hypothetical protein